ncbi:MAG: alpha/beta fold hydrolase [Terracidiphilus sp.]
MLDAAYVRPAAARPRAVVLICHGIAETVDRWLPVQQLLASNGVASLVFDYSGFGKSTGHIDWRQCEIDAISAFRALQQLEPAQPIALLGFSLGSGIAAAVVNQVDADRLILCAAFTSFRDGARAGGLPALLNSWAPPIWSAEHSLRGCRVPVLVVHGEKDRLFQCRWHANWLLFVERKWRWSFCPT